MNTSFCTIYFGTKFPFFSFNLISTDVSLGETQCSYRSHGGWCMLLALLPIFWKGCPFTWLVGLAIGIGLALIIDVATYLLFIHKIKQYIGTQSLHECKDLDLDTDLSYFVGVQGTDVAAIGFDNKQYVLATASEEELNSVLASMACFNGYTPLRRHVSIINNYVDILGGDGIYYVRDGKYKLLDRKTLAKKNFKDYLCLKLNSQPNDKRDLFIVDYLDNNKTQYLMSQQYLIVFFTEAEAKYYADNTFQQYSIYSVAPEGLLQILAQLDGLAISDQDGRIIYKHDSDYVIKALKSLVESPHG